MMLVTLFLAQTVSAAVPGPTILERVHSDPEFHVYSVIFGIIVNVDSTVRSVRVAKVTEPISKTTDAVNIHFPETYVKAVRKLIEEKQYSPKLEDGKPVEFFLLHPYSSQRSDN